MNIAYKGGFIIMKKYCLMSVAVLIIILTPVSSYALGTDKFLHFGVSVILGGISESYLHYRTESSDTEKIFYGTLIGVLPGFAKEVIDDGKSDNSFSGEDMVANAAGALVGSVVAYFINDRIMVKADNKGERTGVSLSYRF
jgi:VanZ family protein